MCRRGEAGWGGFIEKYSSLLPCSTCWIRTSSFPWSCPSQPPLHICIRRRQAEMWQTNLAHTLNSSSVSPQKTKRQANAPVLRRPRGRQRESCCRSQGRPEGGAEACPPSITGSSPSFFLFFQDGNVHLKTSLLYRGHIAQLSALLSARQVPIKPLIYGPRCIPLAPARRQFCWNMRRDAESTLRVHAVKLVQPQHLVSAQPERQQRVQKYSSNVAWSVRLTGAIRGRAAAAHRTSFVCCDVQPRLLWDPEAQLDAVFPSIYMQKIACRCMKDQL